MKCWKCGTFLPDGTGSCVMCGTSQSRPAPKSEEGRAMREIYDHFGRDEVLGSKIILPRGLGDKLYDSEMLRKRLSMAVEAGVGSVYLEQLNRSASPDGAFDQRVFRLLTEEAGLSDTVARELQGFFDEMIGWRSPVRDAPERGAWQPRQEPAAPREQAGPKERPRPEHKVQERPRPEYKVQEQARPKPNPEPEPKPQPPQQTTQGPKPVGGIPKIVAFLHFVFLFAAVIVAISEVKRSPEVLLFAISELVSFVSMFRVRYTGDKPSILYILCFVFETGFLLYSEISGGIDQDSIVWMAAIYGLLYLLPRVSLIYSWYKS